MIYLIRTYGDEGKSALKVGFASDLERRLSQYFYMNPLFEFVSSREGDEILEDLLHYYLYYKGFQYKIDGKLNEWFIDDPEVIRIFDISIEDLEKELISGFKDNLKGDKLASLVYSNFKTGDRYTSKDIKQKLHEIYTLLGISKTPKATDLGNYFTLVKTKVTLPDKSLSNGFRLDLL